ncbi:MAG TPA: polysaccharide deacetylase family protein [Anaerolineales bacterium]|nr:polysaccharide deacetylase family protein [Anaerolineales bacterium]
MDFLTTPLQHFYDAAQRRFPDVLFRGDGSRREIALTFDDGPHPRDTPRLLDVLEKHQVRATFHLIGKSAERHPDLIRSIHRCGHQPALHCYRHVPFPLENPSVLRNQLDYTQSMIEDATGIPGGTIRDLRPPYGAFSARTRSHLTQWGYRLVMWTCIPPHWMQPVEWSIHQVMKAIVPGAVIVLHDGHGHGTRAAEIVNAIIPQIRSLGFTFVTVEEMQAGIKNKQLPK